MNEQTPVPSSRWDVPRIFVTAVAAAQTAFWIYTWQYLISHANPKGDGMELVATVPLTLIFLVFVLPAFIMALSGRALKTAIILLLIGGAANVLLWGQILSEFAAHAPR